MSFFFKSKGKKTDQVFSKKASNVDTFAELLVTIRTQVADYLQHARSLCKTSHQFASTFNNIFMNDDSEDVDRMLSLTQATEQTFAQLVSEKCDLLERVLEENTLQKITNLEAVVDNFKKRIKEREEARNILEKTLQTQDKFNKRQEKRKMTASDREKLQASDRRVSELQPEFCNMDDQLSEDLVLLWQRRGELLAPILADFVNAQKFFSLVLGDSIALIQVDLFEEVKLVQSCSPRLRPISIFEKESEESQSLSQIKIETTCEEKESLLQDPKSAL